MTTTDFQREERYLVVKLSDFHTEQDEDAVRGWLRKFGVPTRQCVVVEADWPIYDEVWDMVQRLAEGRSQKVDEMETRHALLRSTCESVIRGLDFARDGEAIEREQDKLEVALKRDAGTTCPDEGCPHYGTPHSHPELEEGLWGADPNCEHDIQDRPGGGIKCTKCNGWFCY